MQRNLTAVKIARTVDCQFREKYKSRDDENLKSAKISCFTVQLSHQCATVLC